MCVEHATGPHADIINGIYEPTDEVRSGLLVYQKKGNNDMWLEYVQSKWNVVSTSYRGTTTSYAYITANTACLPFECTRGKWNVWMGGSGKELDSSVTCFNLMIEEYCIPLVQLVRSRSLTPFLGKLVISTLVHKSNNVSATFESILFS